MRFYLACVAAFALMLFVLHSCCAEEFMSVTQVSYPRADAEPMTARRPRVMTSEVGSRPNSGFNSRDGGQFHKVHGKGGEARKKELHRRRMVTVRHPRHALSAALPRPHPGLHTPIQIIETEFLALGWKPNAELSKHVGCNQRAASCREGLRSRRAQNL